MGRVSYLVAGQGEDQEHFFSICWQDTQRGKAKLSLSSSDKSAKWEMSGQKKSIKKQHAGVRFWWIYNLGGFEYFQEMCAVSKQYDVMHALTHITNMAEV